MIHPIRAGLLAGVAVLLIAGPAAAEAGRFVMEPTENGYVRMDTQTGEMSVCALEGEQVICTMAADERTAFQDALDDLEGRIAVLERRLNATADDVIAREGLPSPEEFEQGLGYMEEFVRRFMGIVDDLESRRDM